MANVRCSKCRRVTAEEKAVSVAGVLYGPECASKARAAALQSDEDWIRSLSEESDDDTELRLRRE
jgi:late competence protein required for DNA uptake (superfamily II DNA/RNA helicase)